MGVMKVFVINDEGEDIGLERDIIADALVDPEDKPELMYIPASDSKAVAEALPEADAVISVYTVFDRETLEKMQKCKIIATQTIGINTIDLNAATDLGICITNVPDYCVDEVAAHTVTLALVCARKIRTYDRISRDKVWNADDIYGYGQLHRLKGQKYGLVSFGNIGKRVAELMKAFGMEVMAYDPFLPDEVFAKHDVTKVESLEDLFSTCNIISLHTPLTPETEGMIDMNLLKLMQDDGIIINTSRGGIIRENDLYEALKEGIIGAAGTDVILDEAGFDTPLYELDNIVITPHVAYYSEEALEECRVKAATMVRDVLGRKCIPEYLVNKSVADSARSKLI